MTGFYGKLPAKGDFLSRNLPRSFVDAWDDWLQNGMHESRQALGDEWLQIYLTSPLWRFVLPSGTCSDAAWAGVMMPSMDRVGRYFPMAVLRPLDGEPSPLSIAVGSQNWFESVEAILLEALDEESLDLDALEQKLNGLLLVSSQPASTDIASRIDQGVRIGLDESLGIPGALLDLSLATFEPSLGRYSIWWGQGSERIAPSLVFCRGLPGPGRFSALLDGNWAGHGWHNGDEALDSDVAAIIAGIGGD